MQIQFKAGAKHTVEREESEYYILQFQPANWSSECRIAVKKSAVDVVVENTYHVGQRFRVGAFKHKYILANLGNNMINFISLKHGSKWANSIKVYDTNNISQAELDILDEGCELICKCD